MLEDFLLLARFGREEKLIGLGALTLAGAFLGWGIHGMRTGEAQDRWGYEVSGGMAYAISIGRIIAGVGLGIYGVGSIFRFF